MNKILIVQIMVLIAIMFYTFGMNAGKRAYDPEQSYCYLENDYMLYHTPSGDWWIFDQPKYLNDTGK